jgi:hypothetical protein
MTTITEKQVSTPRPGTAIRNPGPLPPIGRELTYDSISSTNNNNNNVDDEAFFIINALFVHLILDLY